jgi:orotate phosphoribosyltransferase
MDDRTELLRILKERSLLTGEFVLASGKVSNYYFDCKLTTLASPRGLELASKLMLERLQAMRHAGKKIDAIGGLTIGAAPLSVAVSQRALREHGWVLPVFVVRDEPKAHGSQRLIEGGVEANWNVVIVDDVMTTGKSVEKATRAVVAQGATIAAVLILVDREEGGSEALCRFETQSLFSYKELLSD